MFKSVISCVAVLIIRTRISYNTVLNLCNQGRWLYDTSAHAQHFGLTWVRKLTNLCFESISCVEMLWQASAKNSKQTKMNTLNRTIYGCSIKICIHDINTESIIWCGNIVTCAKNYRTIWNAVYGLCRCFVQLGSETASVFVFAFVFFVFVFVYSTLPVWCAHG